jgi:carbonic anhydrase
MLYWILAFILVGAAHALQLSNPASQAALSKLLQGNERYVKGQLNHPNQSEGRRIEVAKGQAPFATVLGCADSRVSPEILFDQGLGDLFTVREAGNVTDDLILGNIEYGVEHLNTPLVLVLGHTHCGAAEAAAKGKIEGHIGAITKELQGAVALARKDKGDLVDNIVRNNVKLVVEKLRQSTPILKDKVDKGAVQIVGAVYDIDSGKVTVLSETRQTSALPAPSNNR